MTKGVKMLNAKLISSLSLLLLSSILLAFAIIKPKAGLYQVPTIQPHNFGDGELCDLSVGKWVREEKGSLYTNSTCQTLPDSKNCAKYGKPHDFVGWRWRPGGDSDRHLQRRARQIPNNFTLMAMWSNFLVEATERIVDGVPSNAFDIHLDRPNPAWAAKLPELNYVVISAGSWFFRTNYLYENGSLVGCDDRSLTHFTTDFLFRRVFRTSLGFIGQCEECDLGLVAFLRTFSPSHFEHGSWFTGGYCNRTRPMEEREAAAAGLVGEALRIRKIQMEELGRVEEGARQWW